MPPKKRTRRRWRRKPAKPPRGLRAIPLWHPKPRTLDRIYKRLAQLARLRHRRGGLQTRIAYFGDSHLSGDHMAGTLRRNLQRLFGDAGAGYVTPGKPRRSTRHADLLLRAHGPWRYYYLMTRGKKHQPRDGYHGVGGISAWVKVPVGPGKPKPYASD